LVNVAKLYALEGFYVSALATLRTALTLDEEIQHLTHSYGNGILLGAVGNVLFALKRYNEAIVLYDACITAIGHSQSIQEIVKATCYCNIALCYHMLQTYPDAILFFEKSLSCIMPLGYGLFQVSAVLVHYGCTLYHLDKFTEVCATTDRALKILENFRPQMSTYQLNAELHIYQRAYMWLSLTKIKTNDLMAAVGLLEYCGMNARADQALPFSDSLSISQVQPQDWASKTITKLNTPMFIWHVARYEGLSQQILLFLILPKKNGLAVHFRRLMFGIQCSPIHQWMDGYLSTLGIVGWTSKQLCVTGAAPRLPYTANTDIIEESINKKITRGPASCGNTSYTSPLWMGVVGFLACLFFACVNLGMSILFIFWQKEKRRAAPKGVTGFPRITAPPMSYPTVVHVAYEFISKDCDVELKHIRIDKSADFLRLKDKFGISPLKPPFVNELNLCRELYDIFIFPFEEELSSLGDYAEIIFIATDCMVYLPLNALLDPRGNYIIDRFKLMYSPNLMISAHLLHLTNVRERQTLQDGVKKGIWLNPVLAGRSSFFRFPKLKVEEEVIICNNEIF
jgi:tetratricopeptide (TPR) repeat protein